MKSRHPASHAGRIPPTLYLDFTHEAWGRLRADTPLTLSEAHLTQLRGLNEGEIMRCSASNCASCEAYQETERS